MRNGRVWSEAGTATSALVLTPVFGATPERPDTCFPLIEGGNAKAWSIGSRARVSPPMSRASCAKNPPFPPRWLTAETPSGLVRAFSFTHPGKDRGYAGHLADETVADALARAVGMVGSMAQYVYLTAQHLEQLGLCDDRMWRMQEMIAERIELAFPDRIPR